MNTSLIIKTYPVSTFYLLAFGISWLGWGPSLATAWGLAGFGNPLWRGTLVLAATGPALAAALVVRWAALRRLPLWPRVGVRWYGLALVLPLALVLGAALLARWGPPGSVAVPARGGNFGWFLLLSGLANPWEEVGWRSFALRRLQATHSAAWAALVVGALWALWHLPLFLLPTGPFSMAQKPVLPWVTGTLAQSFILAWLFNRTRGSLLVVVIYHVATNGFGAWVGVPAEWALTALKIALAAGLWLRLPTRLVAATCL